MNEWNTLKFHYTLKEVKFDKMLVTLYGRWFGKLSKLSRVMILKMDMEFIFIMKKVYS